MLLLHQLRAALRRLALPTPARLVMGVSGGPDSLCLLHALHALRAELRLELHVAHLDHAFRGAESAAEAAFVASFAQQLGLPATVARRDVPALVARAGLNAQAAARAMRYAFLAEVALAHGAHAVAVAHHADDQAETVLMHLLRGAGPAGLRGMRPLVAWQEWAVGDKETRRQGDKERRRQGRPLPRSPSPPHPRSASGASLIRPLLGVRRAAIESYCASNGLEPRRDPSNEAPRYARTRVRADLMPLLARHDPRVAEHLGRTAAVCADDYDYMQRQLDACWPALVAQHSAERIAFDGAAWRALHPAMQRYALRRAAALLGGDEPSLAQIEAARHATALPVGARSDLPGGVLLTTTYNGFALGRALQETPPHGPQLAVAALPVALPGVTALGGAWRLEVAEAEPAGWARDAWSVVFDADALGAPLLLRVRQSGDRMRLAAGSRALQDLFVDQKLPRALRDRWPLLTSPAGIAWAVGLRADLRFVAGERTDRRLWLRCIRPDNGPNNADG